MSEPRGFYYNGRPVTADNSPVLRLLPDGVNSVLVGDLIFIDADGGYHVAYDGLRTDGGSIPRFFWRLIGSPWSGKHRFAFIIHDQECIDAHAMPAELRAGARKRADTTLYEMCRYLGDSEIEAACIYLGVRVGARSGQLATAIRRATRPCRIGHTANRRS